MYRLIPLALALIIPTLAHAEVMEPKIVARTKWEDIRMKPRTAVMVEQKVVKEKPVYKGIVVHHTVVSHASEGWAKKTIAQTMRDIQADHMKNVQKHRPGLKGQKWGDFAYHYLINTDGQIVEGRSTAYEGDSSTNYNMTGLLLVVLHGDFTKDRPTAAQLKSLDQLTAWLAKEHNVKGDQITAHNDHVGTKCPGPNLKGYLPELKRKTIAALK